MPQEDVLLVGRQFLSLVVGFIFDLIFLFQISYLIKITLFA